MQILPAMAFQGFNIRPICSFDNKNLNNIFHLYLIAMSFIKVFYEIVIENFLLNFGPHDFIFACRSKLLYESLGQIL